MQLVKEKILKSALLTVIIALCAAVMALILFGVKQFQTGSQLAGVNQVANLSHLLVRQQTNLFSMLLQNNANGATLTESLDKLINDDMVLDASLYANNGELLAQSTASLNLRRRLGLGADESERVQQIVEPIYAENSVIGFLRVSFDGRYGQATQSKVSQLFHHLYGELIIVFLVGALLASSVHYFLGHYRRIRRRNHEATAEIVKSTKLTGNSYHRRRRLWRR
ncbi:hemolysin regulation protein AhpA [Actinobacillus succinogenes]|uniref:Membrane protein n=1 Tax=Actinobacillus succinogenes (strain ATCC 55618 / DSM 22257 / CCUG 43843 / 130Z) TaxID=339671 RepID=A6VR58_ACTSZ|nr:YtjB family periplasmic protein [Actinobacillus succinogenes]ABR75455.1 membrane protein [Actinobacillus succinogenes 130Z]PHI40157.1 hemolysin regulation protein AhpA [Actinobacillus succinogenes]